MWLADNGSDLLRLTGRPGRALPVEGLPAADRALWGALSPASEVVALEGDPPAFWRHVHIVSRAAGSQFDILASRVGRDVALDGPAACLAIEGVDFHGHRGRPWTAARGNLHLSAAIPARLPASSCGLALTMLPAVAVVDAVAAATGGGLCPDVKWVNDLLLGGGKIAGVLTTTQTRGTTVELVVVGIGLNVEVTPDVEPTPFVPRASCLVDATGQERLDLARILNPILTSLAVRFSTLERDGPDSLFAIYRERSVVPGKAVRIWDEGLDPPARGAPWPEPTRRGVVVDLAPDLSLGLDDGGPRIRRGRLALEEDCLALGI